MQRTCCCQHDQNRDDCLPTPTSHPDPHCNEQASARGVAGRNGNVFSRGEGLSSLSGHGGHGEHAARRPSAALPRAWIAAAALVASRARRVASPSSWSCAETASPRPSRRGPTRPRTRCPGEQHEQDRGWRCHAASLRSEWRRPGLATTASITITISAALKRYGNSARNSYKPVPASGPSMRPKPSAELLRPATTP